MMDPRAFLGTLARLAALLSDGPYHFVSRSRVGGGGREHPVKARRWLRVWLVLLVASGCAERDWVADTLVTVDVTGRWAGKWFGPGGGGDFGMTLRQTGPKVKGDVELTSGDAHNWNGSIVGTVKGDGLTFSLWDWRLRGDVTVDEDEMSGTVTFTPTASSGCCPGVYTRGTKTLTLRRVP